MSVGRLLGLALIVSVIGGAMGRSALGQEKQDKKDTPGGAAAAVAAGEAPEVKLLDAGSSEGRKQLRFNPKAGDVQSVTMRMKMKVESEMNGTKYPSPDMPGIEFNMKIRIEDVAASGDIRYTAAIVGVDVYDTEGVEQRIVDQMKRGVGGLKDLHGEAVMTDRGIVKSGKFTSEDAEPLIKGVLDGMNQSWSQFSTPLPAEAIGVGARWEVLSHMAINRITTASTATYTVKEFTKRGVKLDVVMEVSADPQDLPAGADAKVHLVSMSGKNAGKTELDLVNAMPVQAEVAGTTKSDMTITAGEQRSEIKQAMTISLGIAPTVQKKDDAKTEKDGAPAKK